MLKQAVWILAVTPIRWTPRRLQICHLVRLIPEHTQEGLRRHGARPHFNIVGLLQHAPTLRPKRLELQDELLKRQRFGLGNHHLLLVILREAKALLFARASIATNLARSSWLAAPS